MKKLMVVAISSLVIVFAANSEADPRIGTHMCTPERVGAFDPRDSDPMLGEWTRSGLMGGFMIDVSDCSNPPRETLCDAISPEANDKFLTLETRSPAREEFWGLAIAFGDGVEGGDWATQYNVGALSPATTKSVFQLQVSGRFDYIRGSATDAGQLAWFFASGSCKKIR